jgi:hypothetical protein
VVVDQFTKLAHFIIAKSIVLIIDEAKLFICEIFYLHGLPKKIICNRD